MSAVTKCIEQAINGWWGTKDPRPALPEAIALGLAAAGFHVVQEGDVPPWMVRVGSVLDDGDEIHDFRYAAPKEGELEGRWSVYRLRNAALVGEGLSDS